MTVITVQSSPRQNGNTATVLGWVEEALAGMGHEVTRINLARLDVRPCQSCFACQSEPNLRRCVVADDAPGVFHKMAAADLIVLATPLYFWGVCAQLKALVDRSFSVVTGYGTPEHTSGLGGGHAALLVTCEDAEVEDNADFMEPFFRRLTLYWQRAAAGELIVTGCKFPDALGDDVRARALQFAQDIARGRRL